jgi:molybdopterin-guanine dinucleotide biosynthesis protein A
MKLAAQPLVITVPCDSPYLPADLVARLRAEMHTSGADLAVAKTGAQAHPVFALARRSLLANLEAFLAAGGRKIDAWYAPLKIVEVLFDDQPDAFSNINTRDELAAHEVR